MRKIAKRAAAALAAIFLAGCGAIIVAGLRDDIQPADVAIVFASKVERDLRPSARLVARLEKTLELYRRGLFPFIIVSGGIGSYGDDEAQVMMDWLVTRGVPAERIHADKQGVNTYVAARNSARFMREHEMKSAIAITQYFHIPRARLALRRFGIEPVHCAHANYVGWKDVWFVPREAIGWCVYALRRYPPAP